MKKEIEQVLSSSGKKIEIGEQDRGIRAVLDRALMSYEKLPMLEVVMDRFVRMLTTSLRNLTSENVDVLINSISSLRFGDYMSSIPMPTLISVFKVIEWENFGLVVVNEDLLFAFTDILFGGRKSEGDVDMQGRSFTAIEHGVIKHITDIIFNDLCEAFEPLSPATFAFERTESNPNFATIARPADAAILIQLDISMESRSGKVEILFPYDTLEPVRDLLLQVFIGDKFGKDPTWQLHLEKEIHNTSVDIEVRFGKKVMLMNDVMKFEVGSTILLDSSPGENVIITSHGIPMFEGVLGQVNDKIAASIELVVNKNLRDML